MPFKSEKQRRWMHANKPEMAKDWEKKLAYSDRKEKMKKEQRVKELIKKMVREELNQMNEGSDTFVNILNKFGFKKGARDWGGHQFFVHKSKDLYATYNPNGRSLVIEPKRGGKPVFDSDRSNFSIRALLSYLQSPKNKFVSTEEKIVETDDHEGKMAKSQLERSMKYSKMIYKMIDNVGDGGEVQFPAWVQSKLTKSMDYLQSVYNYLDGKDGLEDKFQNDKLNRGNDGNE